MHLLRASVLPRKRQGPKLQPLFEPYFLNTNRREFGQSLEDCVPSGFENSKAQSLKFDENNSVHVTLRPQRSKKNSISLEILNLA